MEAVVPLLMSTLVVKEASSSVIAPPTRLGLWSESEGVSTRRGTAQGTKVNAMGLWSAGAS